jgi:methyl-accepting chemotaxis protein
MQTRSVQNKTKGEEMKKSKSLLSKMMYSVGTTIAIVCIAMAGILVLAENQYGSIQSVIWITAVIGLIVMLGAIVLTTAGISKRIAQLTEAANHLATGAEVVELNLERQNSRDQIGDLSAALAALAETMKAQSAAAKKMAAGNFPLAMDSPPETATVGSSLIQIGDCVARMNAETALLSDLTGQGIFNKRADVSGLSGTYEEIIENINAVIDHAVKKMHWYENILDTIPYPLHVMDKEMKWLFINKMLEQKLQVPGIIKDRESAYGTKCCEFGIEICNSKECTDACGMYRLISKGTTEMQFEFAGTYNQKYSNYVKNDQGENVGFVELSSDLTPIMSEKAYTDKEVSRLEKNLLLLVEGNLEFDLNITEAGEYTGELHDQFTEIGENLNRVRTSISNLIEEATMITDAAVKGRLETRADESKFNGAWKTLIGGMNNILEEIARPTREIAAVMNTMSSGNLQLTVEGTYEGEFDELKQSVNTTAKNLKMVVSKISEITGEIAAGNLAIKNVEIWQNDFASVSEALNTIIETLNVLMRDIHQAAEQVTAGSNQVSDGSQALAQGSTEQASSIQELTASISEIADQTKKNAVDANQAKELTTDVRDYAVRGNAQMIDMQSSMQEINRSSEDISRIIKVIDDIAFQTNILALNAAVEAARAGQQGKGFAVVAEEVRTLAARSADAAKETTLLIEGSISKVQAGTKIADETASALTEIVGGIRKVTDLMENIAIATNEQATGITQINMGVEQVAQVVQNNSATAEQSAAASEELSSQAELLKEMIGRFQLRN